MLTIRTIGVAIAFSAAATAFAGEQVQWRADELSTDSQLPRAQVIAEYQAARDAGRLMDGELSVPAPAVTTQPPVDRAKVLAEATAARDAGWHTMGDRYFDQF